MAECVSRVEPRIFRLAGSVNLESLASLKSPFSFRPRTLPESGTLELHFDDPQLLPLVRERAIAHFADIGESIAWVIDRRKMQGLTPERVGQLFPPPRVVYEARSRIELQNREIDVIGPGGTFSVYQVGERLTADATLRRREGKGVLARWRDPVEIVERARAQLRQAGGGSRFRVNFGYFEASKYEPQKWLALTFAFAIDRSAEGGPRFAFSFVESATVPREMETARDGQ
jgi:hypothetical protein